MEKENGSLTLLLWTTAQGSLLLLQPFGVNNGPVGSLPNMFAISVREKALEKELGKFQSKAWPYDVDRVSPPPSGTWLPQLLNSGLVTSYSLPRVNRQRAMCEKSVLIFVNQTL